MSRIWSQLNSTLAPARFTVTVEDLGIFGYGFSVPEAGGSLSPATFRGVTVRDVLSPSISGGDVSITIAGTLPQDFFRDVTIQNAAGSTVNLLTSGVASFSVGGSPTSSTWRWTSAGALWDATTVGLARTMVLR